MKLCKDCKWHKPFTFWEPKKIFGITIIPAWQDKSIAYCMNPKATLEKEKLGKFLVNGESKYRHQEYCSILRAGYDFRERDCGPDAKWYEPKEPQA